MGKYPATTRTTAGKLTVGDVLLVREGQQDLIPVSDRRGTQTCALFLTDLGYDPESVIPTRQYGPEWVNGRHWAPLPGTYRVDQVDTHLERHGRKATRFYTLKLVALMVAPWPSANWAPVYVTVSSVQRLNLVTPATLPAPTGPQRDPFSGAARPAVAS